MKRILLAIRAPWIKRKMKRRLDRILAFQASMGRKKEDLWWLYESDLYKSVYGSRQPS